MNVKSVLATLLTKVIEVGLLKVALTVAADCEGATPINRVWFNVLPVRSTGDTVTTAVNGGAVPVLLAPAKNFKIPAAATTDPEGI